MQQQQQLAAQAHSIEYNQTGDRPGFLPGRWNTTRQGTDRDSYLVGGIQPDWGQTGILTW